MATPSHGTNEGEADRRPYAWSNSAEGSTRKRQRKQHSRSYNQLRQRQRRARGRGELKKLKENSRLKSRVAELCDRRIYTYRPNGRHVHLHHVVTVVEYDCRVPPVDLKKTKRWKKVVEERVYKFQANIRRMCIAG
jgi:hypothetical protein